MTKKLKISIITCCKNSMPYLKDNIFSVNNQNYRNFEHIFVLSKSTDGTYEYLKKEKKIFYKFESNNIYKCINFGIEKSSGDIIYLLHSDDKIIHKNLFSKVIKIFNTTSYDFLYGNCLISKRDDTNKIIRWWKSKNFKRINYFFVDLPAHTTFFLRRKIHKKTKYNTKYSISSDFDFLIKIFKNFKGIYLDYNFICMRTGGTSSKFRNFKRKMFQDISIIKKYYSKSYLYIYILKLFFKFKQKLY